jgi:hypothetical protein
MAPAGPRRDAPALDDGADLGVLDRARRDGAWGGRPGLGFAVVLAVRVDVIGGSPRLAADGSQQG